MKNFIFILCVLTTFYSCNNTNKQGVSKKTESNNSSIDSILPLLNVGNRNELNKQVMIDSINQAKIDMVSLIAWGDAKFGMSRKTVKNTLTFKKATSSNTLNPQLISRMFFSWIFSLFFF